MKTKIFTACIIAGTVGYFIGKKIEEKVIPSPEFNKVKVDVEELASVIKQAASEAVSDIVKAHTEDGEPTPADDDFMNPPEEEEEEELDEE